MKCRNVIGSEPKKSLIIKALLELNVNQVTFPFTILVYMNKGYRACSSECIFCLEILHIEHTQESFSAVKS